MAMQPARRRSASAKPPQRTPMARTPSRCAAMASQGESPTTKVRRSSTSFPRRVSAAWKLSGCDLLGSASSALIAALADVRAHLLEGDALAEVGEGVLPASRVEIDGVDQCAVDVEEHRLGRHGQKLRTGADDDEETALAAQRTHPGELCRQALE